MTKTKKDRAKAELKRQQSRRANARRGRVSIEATPWDHGAAGQANRIGLVIEERGEMDPKTGKVQNPNGVTGAYRIDPLEFWYKRGTITADGLTAAKVLRAAYEQTMKGPPALPDNDRVQSSPKPDHAITIQIERISRFAQIMKMVPQQDRPIVSLCVLDGGHPSRIYGPIKFREGFALLRDALERLYSAMSR